MTTRPTRLQRWALLLVLSTQKHLGRAPEAREVCAHHRLNLATAARFRFALSGLIRKGLLGQPKPRPRPLRFTRAGQSFCPRA